MDQLPIEVTSIIIFALLLAAGVIIWYIYQRKGKKNNPKRAKSRVSAALGSFARIRKYKVLNDVTLGSVKIDHILVGYFGILFVSDLVSRGYYYGEISDSRWVCSDPPEKMEKGERMEKIHIRNPLPQAEEAMRILREKLAKNDIYKVQMESIAVIADKVSSVQITGAKDKVMNLKGLSSMLSRSKYSSDAGLDVDKICKVILE